LLKREIDMGGSVLREGSGDWPQKGNGQQR
jgi:hypothetical protein